MTPNRRPDAMPIDTLRIAQAARQSLALPILERLTSRLPLGLVLTVDDTPIELKAGQPTVLVRAPMAAWRASLEPVPRVGFQSFGAMTRNPDSGCTIEAEPLAVAQCLSLLEQLLETMRATLAFGEQGGHPAHTETRETREALEAPETLEALEAIRGRYLRLSLPALGNPWIFEEASGEATRPTMLMLHTAGADARQWHGIMTDPDLLRDWHMVAFDMPSHGRSSPSLSWQGEPWSLSAERYIAVIDAWFEATGTDKALVLGCSMGAAIGLALLAERPHRLHGAILLEAPFRSPGRRSPYLDHPAVHGGRISAAWVQALLSPSSPVGRRRRATWIYSQGGPGVYEGDLQFYSDEFDASHYAPRIDTERTPLALLTGEYDYSASPAETARVAAAIPGSTFAKMDGLGHFPMTEDPASVLTHLRPIAKSMRPGG